MDLIDFDKRKSLHIKLMTDTHAGLRIELFKKKLSMQEVFEEFAQLIITGDPRAFNILDDLVMKKKDKTLKKISATDASSIYDIIESSSTRRLEEDKDES